MKVNLDQCRPGSQNKMPPTARQIFIVKPAGHKFWGVQSLGAGDHGSLTHAQLEEVKVPQIHQYGQARMWVQHLQNF